MRLPLLVALLLLPAAPARAIFHLWEIREVYSDASGAVQFLELFTSFASQLARFALPTDGALSLLANGTTATPAPTNFAGEVGTIELPAPGTSCAGLAVAGVLAGLAAWQARRARRGVGG